MTRRPFNRRAFIRGAGGTLIALPFAHFASNGDKLIGAPAGGTPPRLFTISWGTGAPPEQFNFEGLLSSFLPIKDQVTVVRNMSNEVAKKIASTGINSHVAGAIAAFSGTMSVNPLGNGNKTVTPGGASIDQIAYEKFKPNTKLGLIQTGYSGFVDQGGFGDYLDYRSFDKNGKHLEEILNDPYKLFTAFFGSGAPASTANDAAAIAEKARRASVLDGAVNQIKELNSERYGLSAEAKRQLDGHLEKIRELEKAASATGMSSCKIPTSITKERGLKYGKDTNTLGEMMGLIGDLMVVGFQCDLVRHGNICIGESAFHCNIQSIFDKHKDVLTNGRTTDGHEAAHTGILVPIWVDFARYYLEIISTMMKKFQMTVDADGKSMLDNSIFYAATEMSDHSKDHSFENMPALIIGGKGLGVPSGNIIDAKQKPINDALASVLTAAGVPTTKIGEHGTGVLF